MLLGFFRDVMLFKNVIVKADRPKDIERFAGHSFENLSLIVKQIVKTKQLADEKLNVKMSLSLLREYIWAN
jgi:hypothetical protein